VVAFDDVVVEQDICSESIIIVMKYLRFNLFTYIGINNQSDILRLNRLYLVSAKVLYLVSVKYFHDPKWKTHTNCATIHFFPHHKNT
jgi:hypothetical protein